MERVQGLSHLRLVLSLDTGCAKMRPGQDAAEGLLSGPTQGTTTT